VYRSIVVVGILCSALLYAGCAPIGRGLLADPYCYANGNGDGAAMDGALDDARRTTGRAAESAQSAAEQAQEAAQRAEEAARNAEQAADKAERIFQQGMQK
jgi:hypothetical protein